VKNRRKQPTHLKFNGKAANKPLLDFANTETRRMRPRKPIKLTSGASYLKKDHRLINSIRKKPEQELLVNSSCSGL
jgi:hypothetical protein